MSETVATGKRLGRKPKDTKVALNTRIRETTMRQLVRFVGREKVLCEVVDQAVLAFTAQKGGRAVLAWIEAQRSKRG